jgi:hypothetical protein
MRMELVSRNFIQIRPFLFRCSTSLIKSTPTPQKQFSDRSEEKGVAQEWLVVVTRMFYELTRTEGFLTTVQERDINTWSSTNREPSEATRSRTTRQAQTPEQGLESDAATNTRNRLCEFTLPVQVRPLKNKRFLLLSLHPANFLSPL